MCSYIAFRECMRDYTRTLMEEAHRKGSPVMRTMFYEFPEDKKCWEVKEQYMYGSDLLVAPVAYKDVMQRKVYLPFGATWTDLYTGELFMGGQEIMVDAPLEKIPVFIRDRRHPEFIGKLKTR